jgi:hypothetical protein
MVFPASGGFLASEQLGTVYQFAQDKDNQSVADASKVTTYGLNNAWGLAQVGNSLHMAQLASQRVIKVNPDRSPGPTIVSGVQNPISLAADPANGHLFLATGLGGQIYEINPAVSPATITPFATNLPDPDGMSVSPDGSTLYVAEDAGANIRVVAYDVATRALKKTFPPTFVYSADGITLGAGALAGYLFVNTNDHRVVMMSAADPSIRQVIASGGSRGDFAIVDPSNDSVLLTQSDRIERLSLPVAGNTSQNVIQGNLIGTNGAGTVAWPNAGDGIDVFGGAFDNTIGAGNVVSGNTLNGVDIEGNASSGNVVQGCFIGTDQSGLARLANQQRGVFIDGAPDNTVGGLTGVPGTRPGNVISGNGSSPNYAGIVLANSGATGNVVEGNAVGVGTDGTTAVPNGSVGVHVGNAASGNTVGGTAGGAANAIAGNPQGGVLVDDYDPDTGAFTGVPGTGNAIHQNAISNIPAGNLGINLLHGGNHAQAAPVLSAAITSASSTAVNGSLRSVASTTFVLDFFASSSGSPPEGQTFLGQATVTTDGTGQATFTAPLPVVLSASQFVTATATNTSTQDTSEFSAAVAVQFASSITLVSDHASGATYGQAVTITATVTATSGTPPGSVQFTLDGNAAGMPVPLTNGSAAIVLPALTARSHGITATFTSTVPSIAGSTTMNPLPQSVTPAPLTVTADDQSKVYGAGLPPLTVHYTGFVNGDTPISLSPRPVVATTATAASGVGTHPITVSVAADANYTITFVAGTLTITPAPLTITAADQTKGYGAPLPTLTASYSGFVNGDTSTSLTAPPTLATTATAASHVGGNPYRITASGAVDSNYTISFAPGTLTVEPVALTITADSQTKAYGAALPTLTASYSGLVNGDSSTSLTTPPTLGTTATAASHVGSYPITAGAAVDADYTINYVAGTLTVTPAALTITADDQTTVAGGPLPALTVQYAGFANGDTAACLTSPPVLSTTATASSPAGSYAITVSGAADPNYSITFVPGTLTITPALRGITARLVTVKVGKKRRLVIDVFYADTGAKKAEFPSPFQKPAFKSIQVSVRSSTGLGVPDLVVVTARKGKRNVTRTFSA